MINTHYSPPVDLPVISLSIKDGKLIALDWHNDKTARLFDRLNACVVFVHADELDDGDVNHVVAIQTIQQLDEYFLGKRQTFDVPLDLSHGTEFQIKVWHQLLTIPYGKTISYAMLAKNIEQPAAYRACANANGKNLISIIVPCHRVIASDGSLGGYTGGRHIKQRLLNIEKSK